MVVPRPIFTGPQFAGAGWFSLSELSFAGSAGGPGFCFSVEHALTERRFRFPGHTLTPQLVTLGPFRPIFSARKPSKFRATKPVTRLPLPAGGVVSLEPFWDDRRDSNTTRAEQL